MKTSVLRKVVPVLGGTSPFLITVKLVSSGNSSNETTGNVIVLNDAPFVTVESIRNFKPSKNQSNLITPIPLVIVSTDKTPKEKKKDKEPTPPPPEKKEIKIEIPEITEPNKLGSTKSNNPQGGKPDSKNSSTNGESGENGKGGGGGDGGGSSRLGGKRRGNDVSLGSDGIPSTSESNEGKKEKVNKKGLSPDSKSSEDKKEGDHVNKTMEGGGIDAKQKPLADPDVTPLTMGMVNGEDYSDVKCQGGVSFLSLSVENELNQLIASMVAEGEKLKSDMRSKKWGDILNPILKIQLANELLGKLKIRKVCIIEEKKKRRQAEFQASLLPD